MGPKHEEALVDVASPDVSVDASRVTLRRLAWAAALAFLGSASLAVFAHFFPALVLASAAIPVGILTARAGIRPRFASRGAATVHASGDVLTIEAVGTRIAIVRADVKNAYLDSGDAAVAELSSGQSYRIETPSVLASAGIVEALGFAPTRLFRTRLLSHADRMHAVVRMGGAVKLVAGVLVGVLAALFAVDHLRQGLVRGSLVASLVALLCFAITVPLLAFFRRPEVTIGRDGILLRWMIRSRFIRFSEVKDVVREANGVRLQLHRGPSVELPLRFGGSMSEHDAKRLAPQGLEISAVCDAIRRGMAAGGASARTRVHLADLDRKSRPLDTWKASIRAMAGSEGDFRSAPLDPEELASVVEDPASPPDRRVAAAFAVSESGSPEQRRRVRIAIGGCADADMKAALEAAAEGEIAVEPLRRASERRAIG